MVVEWEGKQSASIGRLKRSLTSGRYESHCIRQLKIAGHMVFWVERETHSRRQEKENSPFGLNRNSKTID